MLHEVFIFYVFVVVVVVVAVVWSFGWLFGWLVGWLVGWFFTFPFPILLNRVKIIVHKIGNTFSISLLTYRNLR